jgi:hypothetical protein
MADTLTEADLSARLDAEIAKYARQGYTVTDRGPRQAILQRKARVKWLTVTLLSLLTFGIFLVIVLFRIVNRKMETVVITVDERGKVRVKN